MGIAGNIQLVIYVLAIAFLLFFIGAMVVSTLVGEVEDKKRKKRRDKRNGV